MNALLGNSKIYVYHDSWHEEDNVVIIRKKKGDIIILNPLASSMWKMIQDEEWLIDTFNRECEKRLGVKNKEIAIEFIEKMVQEGIISTRDVELFQ